MEPEPSSDVLSDAIYERFHHQIREHGNTLISFVAEELHGAPPGISITLERLEMPPFHVSWVWFIGSMDQATEQAILRFFQTDAGKAALISHGADVVEFKIASVRFEATKKA
ncbi:hypothetical protein SBRCBS47491_004507 [Sporothrix bragantina]|uniref:EthD domain-containing protein n=1 Tax=Sporothrix bragantina TaxID=671064 RepID=A0ABP0BPB5_9PEZI